MRSRGFTLVEVLVVMTISAILIAAAVPSFQWMVTRNRISDATNLLLGNLEFARMEAARLGNTVSLCRTLNPNANPPVCSNAAAGTFDGNDWASGWIVFEKVPPNADEATFQVGPPSDRVIYRQQMFEGQNVRVMIHENVGQRIAFPPRGTGPVVGAGTFVIDYGTVYTPTSGSRPFTGLTAFSTAGRCLPVALVGSMRVLRSNPGTCP